MEKELSKQEAREAIIEAIKANYTLESNNFYEDEESYWNPIQKSIDMDMDTDDFACSLQNLLQSIPGCSHVLVDACDELNDIINNNFRD